MERLNVWYEREHVGTFRKEGDLVSFAYDEGFDAFPISLSLPLGGGWPESAPLAFLENLLPEDGNARLRQKIALDAPTDGAFDLLNRVDSAGGRVFSKGDEPYWEAPATVEPAYPDQIEARIAECETSCRDSWWPKTDERARFSLAGSQSKFSLARVGDAWLWPSATLPSTHIIKPGVRQVPHSVEVECASMTLAGRCGLSVPDHGVFEVGSHRAYVVERFDRVMGPDGMPRRLRVEDLTQAMGLSHRDKYDVEIPDVVSLLRRVDPTDGLAHSWLRQVMLNMSVGNYDAHAKNYSLMLSPDGVSLCPMYDVLVTACWPQFDRYLAMPLGDDEIWMSDGVTPEAWDAEARLCGLDADRVVHDARLIAGRVLAYAPDVLKALPAALRDEALRGIAAANGHVSPIYPSEDRPLHAPGHVRPDRDARYRDEPAGGLGPI